MSLKVPKANNIQLFKDGYKVFIPMLHLDLCSLCPMTLRSTFRVSRMPSFEISKPSLNYQISYGRALDQTVRVICSFKAHPF
jgi:hypothetical protein